MRAWLLLAGAILTEVTGSLSLKAALDHPLWYVVVAVGYISAFTLLGQVLRLGMGLGVANGIWGASGVALTAVLSAIVFHESLTPVMGVGMALVILGVLLVELGAQQSHSAAGQQH